MQAVKEAELAQELGIKPAMRKAIRDRHLAESDWFRSEETGAIMVLPSGVKKLMVLHELKEGEEGLARNYHKGYVLKHHPKNKKYVYVACPDIEGKVPVLLPGRLWKRREALVGKPLEFEYIPDEGTGSYRKSGMGPS